MRSRLEIFQSIRWAGPMIGGSRLLHQTRGIASFLLFEIAFCGAYRHAMSFGSAAASAFWYPDAVLLCALLVTPQRKWWMYLLGPLPIRLFLAPSPSPFWFLLAAYANDSLKAYLSAMLLQFFLKNPTRYDTLRDFLIFIAVAALLSPAISAFEGAASRRLLGYPFWLSWRQWFLGDALASIILTPLILYWVIGGWKALRSKSVRNWLEVLLAFAGLGIFSYLAFKNQNATSHASPVELYAPVPFLLWIAVRFGLRGTSTGLTVFALLLFDGAARNQGPFLGDPLPERYIHVQFFLFVIGVPSLFVAVLSGERRQGNKLLREAYLTLQESEQRFREMADSAPILIWMSGTDKLCNYFSRGWLEFTGRTPQQELGNGWADGVHPDDLDSRLKIYISRFDKRTPFETEYRLRRHDGEFRWILDRGIPRHSSSGEFLGYIGSAIDITERKLTENALQRSEELYREVVESQTELVCRFRADTTLTFVNKACCKYFGWRSGELIGRRFLELIPPNTWESVRQTIHILAVDHRIRSIEHEVALPGGAIGWVHWNTYVILTPEGAVAEFQAIGTDITDRKRAEEAQERLAHASRLAVVGELTAMVAHEVNQPLTAILHSAEAGVKLMKLKPPPMEEVQSILFDIKEYDLRAGESIRRIRDLLQKHETELQPVNLNEVALDVIHLIAGEALRRRIEIDNYLDPELPLICGDRVHLEQMLLNLIMNGIEAMADSPAALRRLIVQTSKTDNSRIELSVYDAGHGIRPDLLPHIFESFFTTKKEGMGLGLAIVKSIVEKHCGNIRVDANPRGGAVFRIQFPAISNSGPASESTIAASQDPRLLLNSTKSNGHNGK